MAKKSIQWNPVLGPFMNLSGTVFVDRGNSAKAHRSLEAAGEGMKARQTSIFIFVEGTRHSEETPTLLPFKKGAFHLAQKGGIPIIPVVVENYWRLYHKGVFGTGTIKVKSAFSIPQHAKGKNANAFYSPATRTDSWSDSRGHHPVLQSRA